MVKKFITAWGADPVELAAHPEIVEHLARFDLLSVFFNLDSFIPRIKSLNPNCKIIGYRDIMGANENLEDWSEINQHEDWFLHDLNGERLVNKNWGWCCLDIRNQEVRDHQVNYMRNKLVLGFDGVFTDDVWTHFWRNQWTVDESLVPEIPEWHDEMRSFLQYIKRQLGNNLVIANTPNDADYPYDCDGKAEERFPYAWPVLEEINALNVISGAGKYYLAWPRLWENWTEQEFLYSFGCFLLGVNGNNAHYGTDLWASQMGYYSQMDYDFGGARGACYVVEGDLYGRDFDNYKVLVNLSTTQAYSVEVEGVTYNIPAHSGVIVPWEAPPKKSLVKPVLVGLGLLELTAVIAKAGT